MTLICASEELQESLAISARVESLDEALQLIERFLRGAGFVFGGCVGIVQQTQQQMREHTSAQEQTFGGLQ